MQGCHAQIQLVICRHTQTDDNAEHRYTGQNDILLNEVGMEQALSLAQKIAKTFSVKHILCSDLQRSLAVAQQIAHACDLTPSIESSKDVREVHVGRMTGLTKAEALILFPESHHRSSNAHYNYRDIGGESADNVAFRLMRVIDQTVFFVGDENYQEPQTIVLVGHGTALRTVFIDTLHVFPKIHVQGDYQVCNWSIGQL